MKIPDDIKEQAEFLMKQKSLVNSKNVTPILADSKSLIANVLDMDDDQFTALSPSEFSFIPKELLGGDLSDQIEQKIEKKIFLGNYVGNGPTLVSSVKSPKQKLSIESPLSLKKFDRFQSVPQELKDFSGENVQNRDFGKKFELHADPTIGMPKPCCQYKLQLKYIQRELQCLSKKIHEDETQDGYKTEWRFAARVLDRLCLIVFSNINIFGGIFLLLRAPNHWESLFKQ